MYKAERTLNNSWTIEDGMVRFFLIEGKDYALMIDSGISTDGAREFAETLTDLPILLLNTHSDPDHVAGNDAFDFAYMGLEDEPFYRARGHEKPIKYVSEGDIINLGNKELEIISVPGHTPGSIAVLDISERALYAGDTVQNANIYMFTDRRNMAEYIKSLNHLKDNYSDRFDTVYQGHGALMAEEHAIERLIDAAQEVLNGNAVGKRIDLNGYSVVLYSFDVAGFYCDE